MANSVRDRFNAAFLDLLDGYMHKKYGPLKRRLFGNVPATVVDLGAGSGANFRYFPPGTRVIAIEPTVAMHRRLIRKARRYNLNLELHSEGGEELALADGSVDLVCSTLVLCTVPDPQRVMSEVRRVLRPNGRFVAIEHVGAPPGSPTAMLQRVVRRPWRWLFEGCELCNHTEDVIRAAGFRHVDVEPLALRTAFVPVRYQIATTCIA